MPRRSSIVALQSAPPSPLSSFFSIYFRWGWRPAFMIPGLLGFIWLIGWRWLYQPPEKHSRISQAELQYIVADKKEDDLQQENTCVRDGGIS